MERIRYPKGITKGDKIGITAPSAGLAPKHYSRLELCLKNLRDHGYEPVEGECLRQQSKHVSGPKEARARDFMNFWRAEGVAAIMPPWGGEILVEILPLLDFEELKRTAPKWVSGYSDVSTLTFALTLKAGIATLHGSNFMDLVASQTDLLTNALLSALRLSAGDSFEQRSSPLWQMKWTDFEAAPEAPLNLTEKTRWRVLRAKDENGVTIHGRLIGGCLDTIARLVGTPYGDLPSFRQNFAQDGVVFYFENCELLPCEVARTLWNLRLAGWFDRLSGILIGRSAGADASALENLSYQEAVQSVLGDLAIPVIYDTDIGHRPPQLNLINGAMADISYQDGQGTVKQRLI